MSGSPPPYMHWHIALLTSQFVRTNEVLLSCQGPGGQPSAPHRAQKEQSKTLLCEESKMVWESSLGLITFLLPGCMAISLLIICVLSFEGWGLSTTKPL